MADEVQNKPGTAALAARELAPAPATGTVADRELKANAALPERASKPSKEQREADLSGDQHATVAEKYELPADPDTVETAKVFAPVDGDMDAAEHLAQKFGNDPANPKLAPGLAMDEGRVVRLHRVTPDKSEPAVIDVHPEMVGDYLRAGWSQ